VGIKTQNRKNKKIKDKGNSGIKKDDEK